MDELRLAQLLNRDISDEKKLEILKNFDINYTVSGRSSAFSEKTAVLGYNCLHIAIIKSDLDLTKKLLNLGANVLQQGVQDGKTPLRKAMDPSKNDFCTSIWKLKGVLQERPLANAVLFAQIKSQNSFNAKCKSGISHLHIACMLNHTEAALFLARSSESINQAINVDSSILPGYTPLHCAIRYSSSETAALLLTLGADIYLENADGKNSVYYLLERLLEVNDYLKMDRDSTARYTFDREIERLGSILRVIILKNTTDESKLIENTGLSALHLACALKDNWIMQSFIKAGNIENINMPASCKSKLWSGWTPLHFAACFNMETLKILFNNEADIRLKNSNGDTAFDLCLRRHSPKEARMLLPFVINYAVILSDKSTNLNDLMLAMSNSSRTYLKNLKNINITIPRTSSYCPGNNLFHMLILTNRGMKCSHVFCRKTDCSSKISKYVYVPTTDFHMNWSEFEYLLEAGCSVHTKNADGLTPIHLAFKLQEWHFLDELLVRANKNVVGPENVSFLHIACVMGKKEVLERLLNQGADVNSPIARSLEWCGKAKSYADMGNGRKILVPANSTLLHIAVIFKMEESVEVLLKNHADVYAKDELGLTPLHLSLVSTKSIAKLLLNGAPNLREVRREDGLSHLHIAAFADHEEAVRKLLQDGADINSVIESTTPDFFAGLVGKTPLHITIEGNKVARVLAIKGANILAQNPYMNHESPLDIAVKNPIKTTFPFEKLNRDRITIDALSTTGLTTLHIACATLDLDWTKKLLERGANPNAQMCDGQGRVNTPMHLLIDNATSAPRMPANFKLMVESLIEHGADVNISNNVQTPLHSIASAYFNEKVWPNSSHGQALTLTVGDWLLSDLGSYVFNHTDVNGFSYFHFACVTNNLAVIRSYLDSGVDVNHSTCPFSDTYGGFTPLHFAIQQKNVDVVRLLLERGADVRVEDKDGNTPLHLAVLVGLINLSLFDALLRKGADINARNVKNQTALLCLLHNKNITYKQLYFFVTRGALMDITGTSSYEQGIIGFAMGNTVDSDVELVFQTMIEHSNIEDAINKGFRAIHNIVSVQESGNLTRGIYLNAIQKLIEKGSDIDEKDENGKRAIDKAMGFLNLGAIEALLLLGATVNSYKYRFYHDLPYHACRSCPYMRNYLWKMASLKLHLNDTNQYINESLEFDKSMSQLYQAELNKTENTQICGTLNVKHFLSEWGAVIEYPTMSFAKRQTVDNFFKRTADLHKELPELAGILAMQYRKALARVKLMQPVKDILVDAGIDLPDLCLEAILKYFRNDELSLWIEEANEVPCPRKRRRMNNS